MPARPTEPDPAGRPTGADPLWRRAAVAPFVLAIRLYQVTLGPLMGGHCRFQPTCSVYGLEAYRTWGPVRGTWLTLRRLARCHPFGGSGYDPVPLRPSSREDAPGGIDPTTPPISPPAAPGASPERPGE